MSQFEYYHGGISGLKPGDYLRPYYLHDTDGEGKIYCTTDYGIAKSYALGFPRETRLDLYNPGGCAVYRVEPEGELFKDTTSSIFQPNFCCSGARVLSVIRQFSEFEKEQERKLRGWEANSATTGYICPSGWTSLLTGLLVPDKRNKTVMSTPGTPRKKNSLQNTEHHTLIFQSPEGFLDAIRSRQFPKSSLWEYVVSQLSDTIPLNDSPEAIHGYQHAKRVGLFAEILAHEYGADPLSAVVGAYCHDCGRRSNGDVGSLTGHGRRSWARCSEVISTRFPTVSLDVLQEAIEDHSLGKTTSVALIASLWDADRIDLMRFGAGLNGLDSTLLSDSRALKLASILEESGWYEAVWGKLRLEC
jgi:HD domain